MILNRTHIYYKTLTFSEKVAVIREVQQNLMKKCDIINKYEIPPNTVFTFLKNKDKISNSALSGKNYKRDREPNNPEVDECMLKWFKQARDKNISLSGPVCYSFGKK